MPAPARRAVANDVAETRVDSEVAARKPVLERVVVDHEGLVELVEADPHRYASYPSTMGAGVPFSAFRASATNCVTYFRHAVLERAAPGSGGSRTGTTREAARALSANAS